MKNGMRFSAAAVLAGALAPVAAFTAFHGVSGERNAADNHPVIEERREEFKQELKDRREAIKNGVKNKVERLKDGVKGSAAGRKSGGMARGSSIREDLAKRRAEFEAKANVRREDLKKKVGEERAERIEQFFNQMVGKFEVALERLEKFADRIEARIAAAASEGKDVSKARSELEVARIKIKEAAAELESAKAKYAEAIKNPNVKAAFADVRKIIHGVADKVRAAHQALVRSVKELKGVGAGTGTMTPASTQ